MSFKFKKLDHKLIYRVYNFEGCWMGDEPGQGLRTSLFLKTGFEHHFKKSIMPVTLKSVLRNFIIFGENLPQFFFKDELKEFDFIRMFNILENEGVLKEVEEIDKLNLWVVYISDINEALIIDHNEYLQLKELGYEK